MYLISLVFCCVKGDAKGIGGERFAVVGGDFHKVEACLTQAIFHKLLGVDVLSVAFVTAGVGSSAFSEHGQVHCDGMLPKGVCPKQGFLLVIHKKDVVAHDVLQFVCRGYVKDEGCATFQIGVNRLEKADQIVWSDVVCAVVDANGHIHRTGKF